MAYALAFVAAVEVCRSRRSRQRLLATLAFTDAAVAVIGLLHALLGVTQLFGLRAFVHARPPLVTPFGNPNHLAGFLGLSSTVALGLALTSELRERGVLFAAAALLSGAGVLLSLSRAGILFFVFGPGAPRGVGADDRQRTGGRSARREPRGRGAAALLVLVATLAVGGYVAWEQLVAEAASADSVEELRQSGKVELWPMMARGGAGLPVLGMGRGAFESAFPRYQTEPNPNTLTHPENAVLQLAAEFGGAGAGAPGRDGVGLRAAAAAGPAGRRGGGGAGGRGGARAAQPLRLQPGAARVRGGGVGGAGGGGPAGGA